MLEARNIDFTVGQGSQRLTILKGINIRFDSGKLHALIGPSGCGKSTLLQSLLKLNQATGEVFLDGRKVEKTRDLAGLVGFVPQFSIAFDQLTVEQSLHYNKKLFGGSSTIDEVCELVGLAAHKDKKVGLLSGGQRRRLSLALELMNNPRCLVCDEVTTGLDPESEQEIIQLLKDLVSRGITVVCVIHNLSQLYLFDCIHILKAGELCFQGSYQEMLETYAIDNPSKVYSKVNGVKKLAPMSELRSQTQSDLYPKLPGGQLLTLLRRRVRLFFQDKSQFILTCILTFGFPFLVVIFAMSGIPQIEGFALEVNYNPFERFSQEIDSAKTFMQVGTLVSGLIMFQVILLTLMGANNGAREIANELHILRKEKLTGLSPLSYLLSKVIFLFGLSLVQGVWMTLFVKYICRIPSSVVIQAAILVFTVFAMSCVALCISAFSSNSEKSSLIATYLVGFQLPLSGIVLALPEVLVWVFRPFIAAYWGWSGYTNSLLDTRFYDAIAISLDQFPLSYLVCLAVLAGHVLLSVGLTLGRVQKL